MTMAMYLSLLMAIACSIMPITLVVSDVSNASNISIETIHPPADPVCSIRELAPHDNQALTGPYQYVLDETSGGNPQLIAPKASSSSLFQVTKSFNDASYNGIRVADPIGAVSRTTLVAVVNAAISIRSKLGVSLFQQSLFDFFFRLSPLRSLFDPRVVYDEYEDRFFVVVLERLPSIGASGGPYKSRILLAVSTSGSPTSTNSWYVQAVDMLENSTVLSDYLWADFPAVEVSPEAVYISTNLFTFSTDEYGGSRLLIVSKPSFYSGGLLLYSKHNLLYHATPALVHGGPIGNNIGTYLVTAGFTTDSGFNYVYVTSVQDPLGTPTFSSAYVDLGYIGKRVFRVPAAPQKGSSYQLDFGSPRAYDVVWRDDGLWITTTVEPISGPNANQATAYWIKINTKTMIVEQHGEIGGEDIAAGTYTAYPSVAVNSKGVAAFGFAASGPLIYVGAYMAGRYPSDPPGVLSKSFEVHKGIDSYYRASGGTTSRWGDYSGIALDPVDDSFWVYNIYADNRGFVNIYGDFGIWTTIWARFATTVPPPTVKPTPRPKRKPTRRPTRKPTRRPTRKPTRRPTRKPTLRPTGKPTPPPTITPTATPSTQPTVL